MMKTFLLLFFISSIAFGGDPVPPRRCSTGSLPTTNCRDASGFSAVAVKRIHPSKLISYSTALFNEAICFDPETGAATIICPGLYQIAFAGYGQGVSLQLGRKRKDVDFEHIGLISSGGPQSGGGSNQIFLRLKQGDELGIWLKSGTLRLGDLSTSFSAFKLSN